MMMMMKSITLIADDYPTKGHIEYVFVQQLVHAIINMGIKVTIVAPQSIVHNIVRRKKPLPRFSREITEKGIAYEVYRPYKLSFGNHKYFNRITRAFNKKNITSIVDKIDNDILYSQTGEYNDETADNFSVGGSGDVLAGIITALLGQGIKPLEAAACGAWLHGAAGDICAKEVGQYGMLPTDMVNILPRLLK